MTTIEEGDVTALGLFLSQIFFLSNEKWTNRKKSMNHQLYLMLQQIPSRFSFVSANKQTGFLVPMAQSTPSSKRDEDASDKTWCYRTVGMDSVNGAQSSVMVPKL